MTNPTPELTILMPCLNEAETLATCIEKAKSFIRAAGVNAEIMVADNGSTDGSQDIAVSHGARVVDIPMRGYGAALIGGIQASRAEFIIMGDADDSYDFSDLGAMLAKLREGYDLVMGNRFKGGVRKGAMPFLHRYLGNPVLSFIGRLFFRSPIRDFHCGLRGFRREAIVGLDLRTTGMEFASEMVVKASLYKLKQTEVPVVLYPDGRSRPPHLRTWSDGWRHLRFLLMYSPRWLFLYPGLILMAAGALVMAWLLPAPRQVLGVTLDINSMLFAALIVLLGFQAIAFALFTKVFAESQKMLPPDPRLQKAFRIFNLERGILAGIILIVAGVLFSFGALMYWQQTGFGQLDPSRSMRMVIPGILLFSLGCQSLLTSFFLSILGLRRRL